jgi:hypothetical protein
MTDKLTSDDIRYITVSYTGLVLVIAVILYLLISCSRDWAIITGLAVDALGAVLLAAPDLGFYRTRTYSGELRDIVNALSESSEVRRINPENEWYDTFLEEMKDILFTENIPASAYFEVERAKNSNLLFYYQGPKQDGTAINLDNIEAPLRSKIENEEIRVRRYGALIFVFGIVLQIAGLLVDSNIFPGIFC